MKKLNITLVLLIGLVVYSCTTDDSNQTINSRSISKLKATVYFMDEIDRYLTRVYENNKPKTDSIYDINNEITYYSNWVFNDGKLSSKKTYDAVGNLTNDFSVFYDDLNRISQIIDSGFGLTRTTTTNFTYNSDNTITSVSELDGLITDKTFFLNSSGLIFKEVSEDLIEEIVYDSDFNVISKSGSFGTTNYFYDDINLPPENFPVNENNMFGTYKNNYIIYKNSVQGAPNNEASILPKFLLEYQSGSSTTRFEWELNDDNYPISRKLYIQNQLNVDYEYVYN